MPFKSVKRCSIFLVCTLLAAKCFSQDTSKPLLSFDASLYIDTTFQTISSYFFSELHFLYHSADKADDSIYACSRYLVNAKPTSKNYKNYYNLALTLWDLKKTKNAEKMFLTILNSTEKFYTTTYHHKGAGIYGYGSYSTNYKNSASIFLTKIYLEQKNYENALKYIQLAINKYVTEYSCGTGFQSQKDEYDFLLARSYEGMKQYRKALDVLLPGCLGRDDKMIVRVIKKLYSPAQIANNLYAAEKSLACIFDSLPSYGFRVMDNPDGTTTNYDTTSYYSGRANINLFGKLVEFPPPILNNGEHSTKEKFMYFFKQTDFYTALKK